MNEWMNVWDNSLMNKQIKEWMHECMKRWLIDCWAVSLWNGNQECSIQTMHFILFTQSNRDGVFWAVKITLVYHMIHGFIFPNLMTKPSFEDVSKTSFSFVKCWAFLSLKMVSSRYTARSQFLFHTRRQMWPSGSLGLELLSISTQNFWIFLLLFHERRILILVLNYYDKALFSYCFLVR